MPELILFLFFSLFWDMYIYIAKLYTSWLNYQLAKLIYVYVIIINRASLLHNLFLEALDLVSATFATAVYNLVPAITFILAIFCGYVLTSHSQMHVFLYYNYIQHHIKSLEYVGCLWKGKKERERERVLALDSGRSVYVWWPYKL